MQRIFIIISLLIPSFSFSQTFIKHGDGLTVRTFSHQQGINYYINTSDTNGKIYGIYYDTVSSGFNYGNEFSVVRLQIYNGITWLYSKPVKLYSKHAIDAPRILDIKCINGKVWICGSFDSSENNMGAGVLVFNGVNWESAQIKLYQTYKDYFEVRQILNTKNQILLTGNFDSIAGEKCNGLVYFNGSNWSHIGNKKPFGFNGVSNIGNVFFKKSNDSLYAYNKNKIAPDSFDISGKTYRKLAVLRNNEFIQLNIPFKRIAGIGTYKKNLVILPSSHLIYISNISVKYGNVWSNFALKDSFYATNYIGGFEQNNFLYLFFQNPNLAQIDVYRFNGTSIVKLDGFKIAQQYINLEFSEETYFHNFVGPIDEIQQGIFSQKVNKIFGIDFNSNAKIFGQTYSDLNNDGIKQNNELIMPYCKVYDLSNRYMTISNKLGHFEFTLPAGNSYTFKGNDAYGSGSTINYTINSAKDSFYNLDIGLSPSNENDIKVKIISHTAKKAKQGFISRYEVQINNSSSTRYNGLVSIGHMPKIKNLTFENFAVLNQNSTSFSALIDLDGHNEKKLIFSCVYDVDSFSLNELVRTSAKIDVFDSRLSNNFDTIIQTVVSAFDPNIKEAFPNELVNIEKEINYTIWFQNEGNDTALNVCVVDSFGSLFSLKDIHITGDSKGGTIIPEIRNNCLIWNFKNIMLPPKSIDSIQSIGFVSFRTRLNNQAKIGDTVYNKASIYFDYQKPVITNNAKVYFSKNIKVKTSIFEDYFSIYPNPNNGKLNIHIGDDKINSIEVLDIHGQMVYSSDLIGNGGLVELPEVLANGIYFIRCNGVVYGNKPFVLMR